MELSSTYTVKHNEAAIVWEFKYDLNGHLISFKVLDKPLSDSQIKFLIGDNKFPIVESIMKDVWIKAKKSVFEIIIGSPDLSFDSFWNHYNHKVKRMATETAWKRLSKKDQLDAIKGIKAYDGRLRRKGIAKANGSTYINQRYWEDDHNSVH